MLKPCSMLLCTGAIPKCSIDDGRKNADSFDFYLYKLLSKGVETKSIRNLEHYVSVRQTV